MNGKILSASNKVEPDIEEIDFNIYKFNNRERLKPENTVIFPCFWEFGTEILGTLYCIPQLMRTKYSGKYSIAIGWYGREFLYRNLVDEFWEIKEEYQWLRKYSRAFQHHSKNLIKVEKNLSKFGKVLAKCLTGTSNISSADELSNIAAYPKLNNCVRLINKIECNG